MRASFLKTAKRQRSERGSEIARFWRMVLLGTLIFGFASAITDAVAQETPPQGPNSDNKGDFLVARRELGDPLFAKTIVLMLPLKDPPVVVGLIVNKPTHVALHDLFPHAGALKKSDAKAYFGGPVDIHDVSAVFRSTKPPKGSLRVFGDVYVTADSDAITSLLKEPEQGSAVHIFLGRAQWGHEQLQIEMLRGSWYRMRVDADPIFSSQPGDVWQTLLDRVEPRPYVDYRTPSAESTGISASTP